MSSAPLSAVARNWKQPQPQAAASGPSRRDAVAASWSPGRKPGVATFTRNLTKSQRLHGDPRQTKGGQEARGGQVPGVSPNGTLRHMPLDAQTWPLGKPDGQRSLWAAGRREEPRGHVLGESQTSWPRTVTPGPGTGRPASPENHQEETPTGRTRGVVRSHAARDPRNLETRLIKLFSSLR